MFKKNNYVIESAVEVVRMKKKEGIPEDKALLSTKDEFDLNEDEFNVVKNSINSPRKTHELDQKEITTDNDIPLSIKFSSEDDASKAIGILMYKEIPWKSKEIINPDVYIVFDNIDRFNDAVKVLSRKWDFVEKEPRVVARIDFDNLNDFKQVIQYMNKIGLFVEINDNNDIELQEDFDKQIDEYNRIKNKKKGTKNPEENCSLMAKTREALFDNNTLDESIIDRLRKLRVRRRWRRK